MKAASLGHQYLTVKSNKRRESFFGGRARDSQKHHLQNSQNDENRLVTPASEPLSRRTTVADETETPSVAVITRSLSDSTAPYVVYESQPTRTSKYSCLY